jgi:hypothetical protein
MKEENNNTAEMISVAVAAAWLEIVVGASFVAVPDTFVTLGRGGWKDSTGSGGTHRIHGLAVLGRWCHSELAVIRRSRGVFF